MAQVSLREVSKVYPGNVRAVNRVSLGVQNKEFMVLVGPSGCGKSTTLRMIAGLEEISEGLIYIGERIVNDVPAKDRDIAMVFQNYALYPHMTVFENMAFGLKLRHYSRSEIILRVNDAADILGIKHLLARKPKELSGGERQRVAVGRAIVRKPIVFLFDEPLSNLDAKLRVQMRTEIHKLHIRLQTTIIYVTHDQTEAMTMGDRISVMKGGVIQQLADPITVYDYPKNKFVAGFIGSPPMNFMSGRIIQKEGKIYFDEGKIKVKLVEDMFEKIKPYLGKDITFG
ncbi:MAG: ATP-binding cassette domain-containing protein, partial [Candidatus Omnitrophica bacterium]|nr:ATP-binding cassette domain-containing protein [Candidatus Omnitrophota bacterium]